MAVENQIFLSLLSSCVFAQLNFLLQVIMITQLKNYLSCDQCDRVHYSDL